VEARLDGAHERLVVGMDKHGQSGARDRLGDLVKLAVVADDETGWRR
jgi:hypothetical protein